jgi:hypothetical protein
VKDGIALVHSALIAVNIPDKWCLAPTEVNVKGCGIIDNSERKITMGRETDFFVGVSGCK